MYIEDRLFSERTEEVLYSVVMTEEEYALYSQGFLEFQETPVLWYYYKERINPKIAELEKTIGYNAVFCHALENPEEDPTNPGYELLFDTVPGIKYKNGDYYLMKRGFLGLGREKLTKVSIDEAEEFLAGRFCTTDDPIKLANDRRVKNIYDSIINMRRV